MKDSFAKESRILRFLYGTKAGRIFLKPLCGRTFSKICGAFLSSRLSKPLIGGFVRKNAIDLSEFEAEDFSCFNDFFTRKIKTEKRPIDLTDGHLIAPCDGLLSVYEITDGAVFPIKQSAYTVRDLLGNDPVADRFCGGFCFVFRLCVDHYHRYCYFDGGKKGENTFIPGELHTVRPIALRQVPVFVRNCREYTVIETDSFGTAVQAEVGAMLVGKIRNHDGACRIERGREKGMFLYGGSTVILFLEKGRIKTPAEWIEKTANGIEIPVRMGSCIAESPMNSR